MQKLPRLDRYTAVIIALIPLVLLSSWVIARESDVRTRKQQCEDLMTYLDQATDLAPTYTNGTDPSAMKTWATDLQELKTPTLGNRAEQLILEMANYVQDNDVNVELKTPGALLDAMPGFQYEVDLSRTKMIDACPAASASLPKAFPMVWKPES